MNNEIILSMIQPYTRDGTITYSEFEKIFSFLSLREKYDVVEILTQQDIILIDDQMDEDIVGLDFEDLDDIEEDDGIEILYDESLFKDKGDVDSNHEYLLIPRTVKQSNEILCSLIQQGNRQAMQDICIKNKRLVDKYVIAYEKHYGNRLDFEDLEQVGFLGLLIAAQRFNLKQGTQFSTYAVFWIKQSISREIINHGYAIRIPVHMMEKIAKVATLDNRLFGLGIPFNERIVQIGEELDFTTAKVLECLALRKNYLSYSSLDLPVGIDGESELGDFVSDEEAESVEKVAMRAELRNEIGQVLRDLKAREREIIILRFGLVDGHPRTLEEVGEIFGVTRERIRQIEAKALRKMRNPVRSSRLRPFLEE